MSEPASIAGHQQVAAFLLSLDPEKARNVLRHIKKDVVDDVARAMVDLDPRLTEEGTVERLYRALAVALHGRKALRPCTSGDLGALLGASFGASDGQAIQKKIEERRRKDRPFLEIERHPARRIARALQAESGAIGALVLGHVEPRLAAEILGQLPEEAALDAVRRLTRLESPSPSVMRIVATKLGARLAELEKQGDAENVDRLQSVAELLNNSSPDIERKVLELLGKESAEMAAELREHMFTWEDLATIDKRSMQKILSTVDTKTLAIALKACSSAVEGNLMGNLSMRVRSMVAEEREIAGAVSMDAVLASRAEIMKSIRAMIESGEFRPARGGTDLVS